MSRLKRVYAFGRTLIFDCILAIQDEMGRALSVPFPLNLHEQSHGLSHCIHVCSIVQNRANSMLLLQNSVVETGRRRSTFECADTNLSFVDRSLFLKL